MIRSIAVLFLVLAAFLVGFAVGTISVHHPATSKPKVVFAPKPTPGFPREDAIHPDGYAPAKPPAKLTPGASSPIHISTRGLHLIEGFEGFGSCPYWDPFGSVWTRGYGETDFNGNFGGRCISRSQGESNLQNQVESSYQWAVRGLGVAFNQNQIDALDSFVWNLGAGIFTGSLRYDLQHRQFYAASRVMLQYDHAGGQVLEGLARRRREEVALFLTAGPQPVVETPAQHRAKQHRELRAHQSILAGLEARQRVLRRFLSARGCIRRRDHHERLGPTCRRWFREGDEVGARGRHELRIIHAFHRKGIH